MDIYNLTIEIDDRMQHTSGGQLAAKDLCSRAHQKNRGPEKNVHFPPVTMADMEKALYTLKPQIDKDHICKLKEWGKKNSQMPNDF